MPFKTYYDRLGVSINASQDDIKSAYRKLAQELHPDKLPGDIPQKMQDIAKKEFNELREAYLVLSNPNARSTYDRRLAERILAENRIAERAARQQSSRGGGSLLAVSKRWQVSFIAAALGASCAVIALAIVNAISSIDRQAAIHSALPNQSVDIADAHLPEDSLLAPISDDSSENDALLNEESPSIVESAATPEFTPGEITRFATALLELQPILNSTKSKLETAQTSRERNTIEAEFDAAATEVLRSHGMKPDEYQRIAARTETDSKVRLDVITAAVRIQQLESRLTQ